MKGKYSHVYLGLGTNLGNREANIENAIKYLEKKVGKVCKRSSLYETEPWGFESENSFINACVMCETRLLPLEVLETTQEIEKLMGRTRKSHNGLYSDRIIDIDILLYDDTEISTQELTIPHPLIKKRDFVLRPLSEIVTKEILLKLK